MRIAVVAALLLLALPSPASAAPEKGKRFGDWRIDCEAVQGKPDRCFAVQEHAIRQKGPDGQPQGEAKRILRLSVGYIGPEEKQGIVALVPLGIFLPAGVAYQLDGGEQKPLVVQRCTQDGCVAGIELDDASFKALRAGQRLLLGMKPDPAGQPLIIPVALNGLDAAVATLK